MAEVIVFSLIIVIGLYALHVYNFVTSLDIDCSRVLNDLRALLERRELLFVNILQQLGAGEAYERQLMENVAKLREGHLQEVLDSSATTTQELRKVLARSEEYPVAGALSLKANYQNQVMQIEFAVLSDIRRYNNAVNTFNSFIVSLPAAMFCSAYGYSSAKNFISTAPTA